MHSFLHFKDFIKSYFSGGVICALLMLMICGAVNAEDHVFDFSSNKLWTATSGGTTDVGTGSSNNLTTYYYKENNIAFTASGATHYFNSGYFMLGKSGALLNLPTFEGEKITQIIVHSSSGHSTKVSVNIKSGTNNASTQQTWSTQNKDYTYDIDEKYQSQSLSVAVTNSNNAQITKITIKTVSANPKKCVAPTFTPADGKTFTESLTINASTTTTGAKVVYTTDENKELTASSTVFPAEGLTITSTTTIRAMAVMEDGTLENSEIATATYTKTKKAVSLSFEQNEYTVNLGEIVTVKATSDKADATIKYSTDADENTCAVDENTGEVVAGETPATVTITATIDEDEEYNGATATCTLRIVDPNAPKEDQYKKVTSISELSDNDIIIIACPSAKVAASTIESKKSLPVPVNVSDDEEYITLNETKPVIYTLISKETGYLVYSEGNGYLGKSGITTDVGFMTSEPTANDKGYFWTIDIQEGTVILKNVGDTKRGFFYQAGTAKVFRCYGLSNFGQANYPLTYIYKKVNTEPEPDLTLTFTKSVYTTYVAPCDIEFPTDLSGYIVTEVNENNVITEEVLTAPKGTPVIVKAKDLGTYTLAKAEEVLDDVTANQLRASDGTIKGGNNIYAMAVKSQGVGFYRVKDTVTIPAGKAYLKWENAPISNAKEFIPIGGETTGITNIAGEENNGKKIYYNLNGMRVDNPQKGVYIVNGKKVIF